MKKFITDIKTLAALLMAGAAFTACSSSDDNIIEQPQNPTEPQVYTMVIKASKGGDTTTRALQPGYDDVLGKNTVDAYWSGDETIEVGQYNYTTEKYDIIGTAKAAASPNGETTITAELTSAPNPSSDLNFYLGGKTPDYTGQIGLLTGTNGISENYDYATDLVYSGAYTVDEINKKITPNEGSLPLTFGAAQQAIIKFTLKDKANDAAISPSALTVTDGTSTVELTSIPDATYTANGGDNNVLYVAFPASGMAKTITLTAAVGDDYYAYTTSSAKTFVNGQYYEITVKMTKNENARPLTLEAIEDGTITVDFYGGLSLAKPITYTLNGGAGVDITATTEISVFAGDKVCFYSQNSDLGYDHSEYINIWTYERCYIYGNVMSLIDDSGSGFANDKVIADNTADQHTTFYRLFGDARGLVNHPSKPILLPATTLAVDCYEEMFSVCTSLTTAPELPAETLADACYGSMFSDCTSLTTAPELPATTLADNCYAAMFYGCTSLTTAPMLRATTLAENCYSMMFWGCTNLNYVKCLATDISADYCLDEWLDGVSTTGTFVQASGVTWPKGTSGIPSGWSVTVTTE